MTLGVQRVLSDYTVKQHDGQIVNVQRSNLKSGNYDRCWFNLFRLHTLDSKQRQMNLWQS